jgi:hypothetical protein
VKVWITKYALSTGVMIAEARETNQSDMIEISGSTGLPWHFHKGEYATSEAEAIQQVRKKGQAKLRSLYIATCKIQAIDNATLLGKLPMAKGESR